jgi:hypothetical protein
MIQRTKLRRDLADRLRRASACAKASAYAKASADRSAALAGAVGHWITRANGASSFYWISILLFVLLHPKAT